MNEPDNPIDFVEPQQLRELIASGEKVIIVDVREAEEFAAGHVEGAINIPAEHLAAQASKFSKEVTIVTVCNYGGSRSYNAAEYLRMMGYENAAPLRGGTRGWRGGNEAVVSTSDSAPRKMAPKRGQT